MPGVQLQASECHRIGTRFSWRTTRDLPERGRIGIFNRSYYEEVLIARLHPEILRSKGLPDALLVEKAVWHDRYRSIVDLERHLHANGTRVVKFYLHLSKDEQRKRFLARIDEPEKNRKFSTADIKARKFWKQYMTARGGLPGERGCREAERCRLAAAEARGCPREWRAGVIGASGSCR